MVIDRPKDEPKGREIERVEYLLRAQGSENEYAIMLAEAATAAATPEALNDLAIALLADAIPAKR
jgi:hypothetical protein